MSTARIVHAAVRDARSRDLSGKRFEAFVRDRLGPCSSAAEVRAAGIAFRRLVYPVTRPPRPVQAELGLKP